MPSGSCLALMTHGGTMLSGNVRCPPLWTTKWDNCLVPSCFCLLQGSDRTLRPLIIGPEEDYDPGYFNNEVAAPETFPPPCSVPAAAQG